MKLNLKALALAFGCVGLVAAPAVLSAPETISVRAEDEISEPVEIEEEVFECSVVINVAEHGTITVDKEQGHVGDIVTITAKHDLFYLVDFIKVNETALIESETISGVYTFALVEGANTITAHFVVDAELLGEMSVIYEQAMNKDWTNLFSVENIVRIISFVLNGGILVAIIRYYVKDKKLEKKVEETVKSTIDSIIPQTTRDSTVASIEKVIFPTMQNFFNDMGVKYNDLISAMSVFAKCFALSVENTPEAKRAIIDELAGLSLSDNTLIENVKKYINDQLEAARKLFEEQLAKLTEVSESNKQILEEAEEVLEASQSEEIVKEAEELIDDGTSI